MSFEVKATTIKQDLNSVSEVATSLVSGMHGKTVDQVFNGLHIPINNFYKQFAALTKQGEVDVSKEFAAWANLLAKHIQEQHAFSTYFKDKVVTPVATSNEEAKDNTYGFNSEHPGHAVQGLTVGVRVGKNCQIIKLTEGLQLDKLAEKDCLSDVEGIYVNPIRKDESTDLAEKVHLLLDFQAPAAAPAKKTSKLWVIATPLKMVWNTVTWPVATKTRTFFTLSAVVVVAAWYFDQTPSAETLNSWGTTAKAWTWDKLPTQNVALKYVNASVEYAKDTWNQYVG